MSYFEKLFGILEEHPEQVRANFALEGNRLTALANGRSFQWGELQIPRLSDLRKYKLKPKGTRRLSLKEVVGDVQLFHLMPANAGALFQAASQFNLLEMINPRVSPEEGIAGYEWDKTQGPACALACLPGTFYRNYFVDLGNQIGQTTDRQIDCLAGVGDYLGNQTEELWRMQNGYALATREGLVRINSIIRTLSPAKYNYLKGLLQIGLQLDTEFTLDERGQLVSQAYCSALPVLYSSEPAALWEPFAGLVLEATYEATFYAALRNRDRTGSNKLFLTLVGGGAFGNRPEWIIDAILQTLEKFKQEELEVAFISFGGKSQLVGEILTRF
ncbi:MAG: hypothetical protein AAF433_21745 [Bacteroidota bacterium]